MVYPEPWSDWWAHKTARHYHLRDPAAAVRRLAPFAEALSHLFTKGRSEDFTRAYEKPSSLLAYGNYFLPQTYTRTALVLDELLRLRSWNPLAPLRLLDLGAGTGGATRAALDLLPSPAHATLVDQAKLSLAFAREFLSAPPPLQPPTRTQLDFIQTDLSDYHPPRRDYTLILASFSLSELPGHHQPDNLAAYLRRLTQHLHPSGLLVILEPALASTATTLHTARDFLLADPACPLHVWAPCLHHRPCPLLTEGQHWCHEVRSWTVPPHVNRINSTLRRSVWDLKFSFLALGLTPPPSPPTTENAFRLVSPILKETGKYRFRGCTAAGCLAHYEILRRTLHPIQRRQLEQTERGSLLHAASLQPLKNPHHHRIPSPDDLAPLSNLSRNPAPSPTIQPPPRP